MNEDVLSLLSHHHHHINQHSQSDLDTYWSFHVSQLFHRLELLPQRN